MTENQALESCDSGLCVAADGILIAIKMRSPEPSSAVAIWVLSFISRLWRRCRGPLLRLIISRLTVQAWTSAGWRASEGTPYHRQQRSSIPNRYLRGGAVACANICSAGCPICFGSEEHTSYL